MTNTQAREDGRQHFLKKAWDKFYGFCNWYPLSVPVAAVVLTIAGLVLDVAFKEGMSNFIGAVLVALGGISGVIAFDRNSALANYVCLASVGAGGGLIAVGAWPF